MPADWTSYSNEYDNLNVLTSYRELVNQIVDSVKKYKESPTRMLDLGCGTGNITCSLNKVFPQSEIVAIDNSEEMLEITLNKTAPSDNIKVSNFDISSDSGWKELGLFDVIIMNNVLYTITDKSNALSKVMGLLDQKGVIIISDPVPPDQYSYFQIYKKQFSTPALFVQSVKAAPSFYKIYRLNKSIDSSYERFSRERYEELFSSKNLEVLLYEPSYAGQASLFVLERSNV